MCTSLFIFTTSNPIPPRMRRVRDELLEVDDIPVAEKTVEEVQSELQRMLLNEKEIVRIVAVAPPKDVTRI